MKSGDYSKIFFVILFGIFLIINVYAAGNPAAEYCLRMNELYGNYSYSIRVDVNGGEYGVCYMPNGWEIGEWEFFNGEKGISFSYCAKNGYETISGDFGLSCLIDGKNVSIMDLIYFSEDKMEMNSILDGVLMAKSALDKFSIMVNPTYSYQDYSYWDWRDPPNNTIYGSINFVDFDYVNGWMTPVKDQGSCGSCWDFAAMGLVESKYEMSNFMSNLNPDFSEQEILSCNDYGGSCSGGDAGSNALLYMKNVGVSDESCYKYTATNGDCSGVCSDVAGRRFKLSEFSFVFSADNYNTVKQYILNYGAIVVAVKYPGSYIEGGITRCDSSVTDFNHQVVFVGYNDTGDISTSYFIVKNSWGVGSGVSGYYKLGFDECVTFPHGKYYMDYSSGYINQSNFVGNLGVEFEKNNTELPPIDNIEINVTMDTKINSSYMCTLYFNNQSVNYTGFVANNTKFVFNQREVDGADYGGDINWSVACWESKMGIIKRSSGFFSLDIFPPMIGSNIINNSYYSNKTLLVNLTLPEDYDYLMCGNGNQNFSCETPDLFDFVEGENNLYIYSNDSYGNFGVDNILFFVDLAYPSIDSINVSDGLKRYENFSINYSVSDGVRIKRAILETDINGTFSNYSNIFLSDTNLTASMGYIFNITTFNKNFTYRVYVEDFVGNVEESDLITVQIQNTPPTINDTYTLPRMLLSSIYIINKSLLFADVDDQELNITVSNSTNLIINETQSNVIISLENKSVETAFLEFMVNDSTDVVVRNFTINFYRLNVGYPNSNISIYIDGFDSQNIDQLNTTINVPIIVSSSNYGMINFSSVNITTEEVPFVGNIIMSNRRVEVNSSVLPFLNTTAIITLNNVTYTDATIFKDGEAKACATCSVVDYNRTSGVFTFSVLGFSVYEVGDRTCFDGVKNGLEEGVDCGGPCIPCSGGSSGSGGSSSGGSGGAPSVSTKSSVSRNIVLNNASEISLSMNVNDSIIFFVEGRGFGLSVNNINDSHVSFNFSNKQYDVNFSEEFPLDISAKGYENTTIVFERINETSVSVNLEVSSVLDYAEDVSSNNVSGLFNIVDYWKEILVVVIVCAMILIRFFVLRKMNRKRRR